LGTAQKHNPGQGPKTQPCGGRSRPLASNGKLVDQPERPAFGVLFAICFCHLINDMLQSLLIAFYPSIKSEFQLSFTQIGIVTLAYQLTASLLQPAVGLLADRRPMPFSLPGGTLFTFAGLGVMSVAPSYSMLVAGACILGVGSSVFHPESSRVARMASGGRLGLAQSLFQVGGQVGSALGPVGAALVVLRWGRRGMGAFSLVALVSTAVLAAVGLWYRAHGVSRLAAMHGARRASGAWATPTRSRVAAAMAILLTLIFSKFVYMASFTSYYAFYLMQHFGLSVQAAQLHLFAFLAAAAAGTLTGGALGDRFGRKQVIWFSILGVLPLTLALPYAGLFWATALSVGIGFVLASAFPAIVVYGQELIPGRVGMISGLFFGLSFGAAGIGAALMGRLADIAGIEHVYRWFALLPAIGLLAGLLPELRERAPRQSGMEVAGADSHGSTTRRQLASAPRPASTLTKPH
jgi:FSR family fosmidomycin resistance protein-like MFS transporter